MPIDPRPAATDPTGLLGALSWRYATKRFDPSRRISPELWAALEQSLILTPSSFGLQPWKFVVVNDPAVRRDLAAASWGQSQVTDASHYLVLTARRDLDEGDIDRWLACLAAHQGTPAEIIARLREIILGFIRPMSPDDVRAWNIRQLYIALGQLMTSAAVLGIDSCPMEGLDPAAYDRILDLETTGFTTAVACALGYRDPSDRYAEMPKARFIRDELFTDIGQPG